MNWVVLEEEMALVVGQIFLDVLVFDAFELQSKLHSAAEGACPETEDLQLFRHLLSL